MGKQQKIEIVDGPDKERKEKSIIIPSTCGVLPKIYYSTIIWSLKDELALRKGWSDDDDFLLKRPQAEERSLYRKTMHFFKVYPGMLLPDDVTVHTSENKEIKNGKTGTTWPHSPNWSMRFCEYFGDIVCNPAFNDSLEFVTFIIAEAMRLRIGEDDARAPNEVTGSNYFFKDSTHSWWEGAIGHCQRLLGRRALTPKQIEVMKHAIPKEGEQWFTDRNWMRAIRLSRDMLCAEALTPLQAQVLKQVLLEMPGPFESHPHYDFLPYLARTVKKGFKVTELDASCQLQTCDLRNIAHAWDLYAKENKDTSLMMMIACREKWAAKQREGGFQYDHKHDFLNWKKDWLLFERRRVKTKSRIMQQTGGYVSDHYETTSDDEGDELED